jgi:hypothetical protein
MGAYMINGHCIQQVTLSILTTAHAHVAIPAGATAFTWTGVIGGGYAPGADIVFAQLDAGAGGLSIEAGGGNTGGCLLTPLSTGAVELLVTNNSVLGTLVGTVYFKRDALRGMIKQETRIIDHGVTVNVTPPVGATSYVVTSLKVGGVLTNQSSIGLVYTKGFVGGALVDAQITPTAPGLSHVVPLRSGMTRVDHICGLAADECRVNTFWYRD